MVYGAKNTEERGSSGSRNTTPSSDIEASPQVVKLISKGLVEYEQFEYPLRDGAEVTEEMREQMKEEDGIDLPDYVDSLDVENLFNIDDVDELVGSPRSKRLKNWDDDHENWEYNWSDEELEKAQEKGLDLDEVSKKRVVTPEFVVEYKPDGGVEEFKYGMERHLVTAINRGFAEHANQYWADHGTDVRMKTGIAKQSNYDNPIEQRRNMRYYLSDKGDVFQDSLEYYEGLSQEEKREILKGNAKIDINDETREARVEVPQSA